MGSITLSNMESSPLSSLTSKDLEGSQKTQNTSETDVHASKGNWKKHLIMLKRLRRCVLLQMEYRWFWME
jgi:hypothetical protein